MTETPERGVEAVDRALLLLKCFTERDASLSLKEISERSGLYKSTILRLCVSLQGGGFLLRRPDKSFTLGPELLRLGLQYRDHFELEAYVRPTLRLLVQSTGESAAFYRKEGDKRLCLFREAGLHRIQHYVYEGEMLTLKVGAASRALLAPQHLPKSAEQIKLIQSLPYKSFGERDPETAAVAAPVYGVNGLLGCISLSGPRVRFTPEHLQTIMPQVVQQARTLSREIGGENYWET